jgi:hypothetical protein
VDRLAALGNALLPQVAEWIGRRILEYEREAALGGEATLMCPAVHGDGARSG